MIEIKGPLNPYIYGEISRESCRERTGNQECTDMFVIHADKTRKLNLCIWMRLWRKHKAAQRQQRTVVLEGWRLGHAKGITKEGGTPASAPARAPEGYLKVVLNIEKVFKKHAEKGKQDMRTEAQFKSDSSECKCLYSQAWIFCDLWTDFSQLSTR